MYCIKWKDKNNACKGQGEYIYDLETAQAICDTANIEHSELIHWVEAE